MPDYFDLGVYSRPVSTASDDAQRWFDRGLNWLYAFNHEESIACFERALEADPTCAMAHWGIAYALGPNYNKIWERFDALDLARTLSRASASIDQAIAHIDRVTPTERALIEALPIRYQSVTPVPVSEMNGWNDDYANAMREIYRQHSDDLDVIAFFAEAMLDRTPWEMWDIFTGQPVEGADTLEAKEILEYGMSLPGGMEHPGVLHFYVHLMEMSPTPEEALPAGDQLRELMPDGGHLKHMATHIDVQCGDYLSVVQSNHAAVEADRRFIERIDPNNFYASYRCHNLHFKLWGAMFLGQYETAIEAADELAANAPAEILRITSPPMADRMEWFAPMKQHALIRFGKWQEIIDGPLPDDQELFCVSTATTHYAKGVAYAATGRVDEAAIEQERFRSAVARIPESRRMHNNTAHEVLAVAEEMLAGELEYRRRNYESAFAHLRAAIALEDGLAYDEPWSWMQPVRHAYGALLLEQGHVAEAEAVYRADLGLDDTLPRALQHRENIWSLHGYHECLVRQGKDDLASMAAQQLERARAWTDIPVQASCACRTETLAAD